jgi:hypothetical protein
MGVSATAGAQDVPPPPRPPRPLIDPGDRGRGLDRGPDRRRDDPARGPEFTEPFSRTIRVGRNGSLLLNNLAGSITVNGASGDNLKIDAVKRVRMPNESDARALLQELTIEVIERSNQVEVRTEYPRGRRNWGGSVDYTVSVPTGTSLTLHSVSGDIRVSNVQGELRADTVSGDIVANEARRLRSVSTVSGGLNLTGVEGQEIDANTVSGATVIRNLKASSLTIGTVSGDVTVSGGDVQRVQLQTFSGTIEYGGRLNRGGRYQFQAQSGDIKVIPSNDAGFDLEASSFRGTVKSDFTLTNVEQTNERPGRGPREQSLRGRFGDAGALVTMRSFGGNLSIVKR